jgi:hypothetical protein
MKPLQLLCTLALAAQLTACGGGGDDSGGTNTPPTNSSPPPVNNPPPPVATTVKLTLAGKVTDEPIPNAIVTATVGSQTFTATADANGNYSMQLEVDEADVSGFVTLSAKGVGDQSFVEFTSLAGSFESLVTKAGGDGTLASSESFATQITNVSTAEAVLLKEANGGQPITSNAVLESLGSQVNAQDILDLATAIKLSVDDAANYPLPAGQTSILAIATDPSVRAQFIETAYSKSPETFNTTQTAVAQDPDLSKPLTSSAVPASIRAATLSTDAGFTFNFTDRVSDFTFNADGTGRVATNTFDQPVTWQIDGATIKVTFSETVDEVSFDTENCNGTVRQVEAHYASQGTTLTLLSSRTLLTTDTSTVTYADCPSLQPRTVTTTTAHTIVADSDFYTLTEDELKGTTFTVYVHDSSQNAIVADVADLTADGNGTTRLLNKSFTWTLDSTSRIITATFTDGTVARYRALRDFDELTTDLFYEVTTPGGRFVGAGASVYADPEYPLVFDSENVVGSFYQFGVGDETYPDPRLKGFSLRVDEGGVGSQVFDYVDPQNNVVVVNENVDPFAAFKWSIVSGDLVLTKTYKYDLDPQNGFPGCTLGTTDCAVSDVRRIIPIASIETATGVRSYVLEKRQYDYAQPMDPQSTPATYLVRFYDSEVAASPLQSKSTVQVHKTRAVRTLSRSLR